MNRGTVLPLVSAHTGVTTERRCYLLCRLPVSLRMNSRSAPTPDDPPAHGTPALSSAAADEGALTIHPLIVRLVAWRKARGWTQEEAAEHLGIPLNTLRGYECGNRNPGGSNTEKILSVVGLPKKQKR